MKKIVALVLSLVMVLGLATTAFAATTSTGSVVTNTVTPVKAGVYELAEAGKSMTQYGKDVTEIKLTTVTGKIEKDVPMYVPNVYSVSYTTVLSGTTITGDLFMEVAKANATYALKNDGKMIYLVDIGDTYNSDNIDTAVVIDSIVLPADEDVDCGDAYVGTLGTNAVPVPYYVSGEDVYSVGGAKWAYFNGEFVAYDAAPAFKAHKWDASTVIVKDTDVKGVKVPVSIACEDCEKTFKVVNALAFDNTWVKGVDYDTDAAVNGYFIVLKAAATDAPAVDAGDKVESAETFDAGIAMYVGMSVMAAAGSAVVLKKKD